MVICVQPRTNVSKQTMLLDGIDVGPPKLHLCGGGLNRSVNEVFCLFDLILYVHSTIFQLCGTGLPGLNQY